MSSEALTWALSNGAQRFPARCMLAAPAATRGQAYSLGRTVNGQSDIRWADQRRGGSIWPARRTKECPDAAHCQPHKLLKKHRKRTIGQSRTVNPACVVSGRSRAGRVREVRLSVGVGVSLFVRCHVFQKTQTTKQENQPGWGEDLVAEWVAARCVSGQQARGHRELAGDLYADFKAWCASMALGEPLTAAAFGRRLSGLGIGLAGKNGEGRKQRGPVRLSSEARPGRPQGTAQQGRVIAYALCAIMPPAAAAGILQAALAEIGGTPLERLS